MIVKSIFMKKKALLGLSLLILSAGCTTNKNSIYEKQIDTISYKDFVEIVLNANQDDKNIFVFTTGNCPHCQKLSPLLDRYYNNDIDDSTKIYKLSLEYRKYSTPIFIKRSFLFP